jgi:hypothetical protein
VSFLSGPNTAVGVTAGGLLADNTPPSTPIVSFDELGSHYNTLGQLEFWTSNPDQVIANWSADDPESGVSQYEYALWGTPTGLAGGLILAGTKGGSAASSEIRPFTTAGGRTSATIDHLALAPGTPIYVAVRATNGQSGVSGTGVSAALKYDPTPPVFADGAALTLVPTSVVAAPSKQVALTAPCPVSAPAYPNAPLTFMPIIQTVPATWGGTLGTYAPGGTPPSVSFTRPDATDPESGIATYLYHVSDQPITSSGGSDWTEVSARSTSFVVQGLPLNYTGQFYVALVARNWAGARSAPITYGPFRAVDASVPTTPSICVTTGGTPGTLVAQLNTESSDLETGLAGYQYQIRSASGSVVRGWPKGATTDWAPSGSAYRTTAAAALVEGQSYTLDIRAVNQQNGISAFSSSGPLLYDASAAPMPTASVQLPSLWVGTPQLTITASVPDDPHSGISTVQFAVGTTQTGDDVIHWRSNPALAGTNTFTPYADNATSVAGGVTLWIQIRSVNGAGIPSTIYRASFVVPTFVPPPTLRLR